DPRRHDADEEPPVKARVARLQRAVTRIAIENVHAGHPDMRCSRALAVFGRQCTRDFNAAADTAATPQRACGAWKRAWGPQAAARRGPAFGAGACQRPRAVTCSRPQT